MNATHIIFRIKSYLKFLRKAKPAIGHGIHSPFIYKFSSQLLLQARKTNKDIVEIENLRKELKKNHSKIHINDLGAGSASGSTIRKISTIAKISSSTSKKCNLFYELVFTFRPKSVVELGTSLGFASAAMAMADKSITIHTIEGSSEIANIAKRNFEQLGLQNIHIYINAFDNILPTILTQLQSPFLAYIDGNHKYEPTIRYFHYFLEIANSQTILIFDDIHWSEDMERAWKYIKQHEQTVLCIDLYQLGIVFFNKGVVKQNFSIRF